MAQQINLCLPILLKEKHYFSANTIVVVLGLFLLVGGSVAGYGVWHLQHATADLQRTMALQSKEMEGLQTAILRSRANAAPPDPALVAQVQAVRQTLVTRQQLHVALQEGLPQPGFGHSDRLAWVARTIPAPAWITELHMDGNRFEVRGFTLEPAALNDWVAQLTRDPLLQRLRLANIKVEQVPATPASAASVTAAAPMWSFQLLSQEPVAQAASAAGSRP